MRSVPWYAATLHPTSSESSGPTIAGSAKPMPVEIQQRMPAFARAHRSARPSPSMSPMRNVDQLLASAHPLSSVRPGPATVVLGMPPSASAHAMPVGVRRHRSASPSPSMSDVVLASYASPCTADSSQLRSHDPGSPLPLAKTPRWLATTRCAPSDGSLTTPSPLTHIVLEPPPSRLTADHAPSS